MGIQDRDYYREGSSRLLVMWSQQGVVVWLIVATCAVFFLQCLYGNPVESGLVSLGEIRLDKILSGELWRLITPVFLHADLMHLFVNMLVLYWAGSRMEEMLGSAEVLIFYVLAGVFSSFIFVLAQGTGLSGAHESAIGASGAVAAMLVLYAWHFPNTPVYLFFILRLPVWLMVVLFLGYNAYGALTDNRGIAVFAHLGGALFGALYQQSGIRFTSLLSLPSVRGSRQRPVQPRLRVIVPDASEDSREPVLEHREASTPSSAPADEHLEAKLDRILEKVSRHGQESLTGEERELLVKASELYKKRRR